MWDAFVKPCLVEIDRFCKYFSAIFYHAFLVIDRLVSISRYYIQPACLIVLESSLSHITKVLDLMEMLSFLIVIK